MGNTLKLSLIKSGTFSNENAFIKYIKERHHSSKITILEKNKYKGERGYYNYFTASVDYTLNRTQMVKLIQELQKDIEFPLLKWELKQGDKLLFSNQSNKAEFQKWLEQ